MASRVAPACGRTVWQSMSGSDSARFASASSIRASCTATASARRFFALASEVREVLMKCWLDTRDIIGCGMPHIFLKQHTWK